MSARVSELAMKVAGFRRGDSVSHMFYLHGFASSPQSSKSSFLSARLAQYGVTLQCPDLNEPDFSTLTVTRMIEQVEAMLVQLPPRPVAVFGSSLGAFVALHLVERLAHSKALDRVQVRQLVLLAPALEFGTNRTGVRDDLLHWKETGWLQVEHYASGDTRKVHYELFEDARRYDSFAAVNTVPTLIVQGRRDDVVDPEMVERFSLSRSHVRFVMVDDGHQLGESLEHVWAESREFLSLPRPSL